MKILKLLVLIGLMVSGCMIYAMTVSTAQDNLRKANAAVGQAKTQSARKAAFDAVAKAKKDLADAQQAEQTATIRAAVAKEATGVTAKIEADKMTAVTAAKSKLAEVEKELKNFTLALIAASVVVNEISSTVLTSSAQTAAKKEFEDADKKKAQALQLALAYLPVEFLLLHVKYATSGTQPIYYALSCGGNFGICDKYYQPAWAPLALPAKSIAVIRKLRDNFDDRWFDIVNTLKA